MVHVINFTFFAGRFDHRGLIHQRPPEPSAALPQRAGEQKLPPPTRPLPAAPAAFGDSKWQHLRKQTN